MGLTGNIGAPQGERRPLIGISGSSGTKSKSVAAIVTQIRSAGAEPVFLGDHEARIKAAGGNAQQAAANDLRHLDGLIVMGNDGDIDPAKYGQKRDAHTNVETDLGRAAYEEAALKQALDSGMPVLGVCGGMQRINVMGGGTLHQHVPDLVGDNHHQQSDGDIPPFVPVQLVSVVGNTRLAEIGAGTNKVYTPTHSGAPPGVVMENSFHHQAVDKVRGDFQVNAISNDGIIEGIEPKEGSRYSKQYVMGVQWHPEFGASDLGAKIANSVTQASKAYAAQKASAQDELRLNEQGVWQASATIPGKLAPPGQLMDLDPSIIKVDAATYQFRSAGDAKGVTQKHRINDQTWNPSLNEPILVHQRANGEYFVADGHHRLDFAKREIKAGNGPTTINAIVLRESDGYSTEDVRLIAAYRNLKQELAQSNNSQTELVDGARVMKEAGKFSQHPHWLPQVNMDTSDCHVCHSLAKLSDKSLNTVAQGKISAQMAATIAETIPDKAQQDHAIQFAADKLADNYTVTLKVNGYPTPGKVFNVTSIPNTPAAAVAEIPEQEKPGNLHAARILQRRAVQQQAQAAGMGR